MHYLFMGCLALLHHSLLDCLMKFFFWSCMTPNHHFITCKVQQDMVSLSFLHNPTLNLLIRVYHMMPIDVVFLLLQQIF